MKLFVIAALVAMAAAGRLEHLERSYLPPHGSDGGFGSPSSHGSFGANFGAFGSAGTGLHGHNAGGIFAGATSNQYLPPNHGPSASNSAPQFAGSQGFRGQQNYRSQQYSGHQAAPPQQYGAPSSQFASTQAGSSFGASSYQQYPQQSAATSRQYLAPNTGSYQQPPQQAFDEQTGYHY